MTDRMHPTALLVTNLESGRVVKIKPGRIWKDYFDTVACFDDLSPEEKAKVCCDTLINHPDYWMEWFQMQIADDWDYIMTIGKEVKAPRKGKLQQAVRHLEFRGRISTEYRQRRL